MILLETVDLSKRFGDLRACDDVNFTVNKGEFLSLVGSNGAGKTSLVNLISGHLKPNSGRILFEGQDVTFAAVYERIKAGIARSFQIVNLFDGLSVFDNVALSIFSREGKIARIAALADHDQDVRRETFDVLGRFGLNGKSSVPAGKSNAASPILPGAIARLNSDESSIPSMVRSRSSRRSACVRSSHLFGSKND